MNKSSNRFKEGDAVILSYASCSKCDLCQSGYPSNCELLSNYNFYGRRRDTASQKSDDMKDSYVTLTKDNSHLNGNFFGQSSFSKFAIVNISCAVKVDVKDNEELQKLVLGCAFQTGAGAIRKYYSASQTLKELASAFAKPCVSFSQCLPTQGTLDSSHLGLWR